MSELQSVMSLKRLRITLAARALHAAPYLYDRGLTHWAGAPGRLEQTEHGALQQIICDRAMVGTSIHGFVRAVPPLLSAMSTSTAIPASGMEHQPLQHSLGC